MINAMMKSKAAVDTGGLATLLRAETCWRSDRHDSNIEYGLDSGESLHLLLSAFWLFLCGVAPAVLSR